MSYRDGKVEGFHLSEPGGACYCAIYTGAEPIPPKDTRWKTGEVPRDGKPYVIDATLIRETEDEMESTPLVCAVRWEKLPDWEGWVHDDSGMSVISNMSQRLNIHHWIALPEFPTD